MEDEEERSGSSDEKDEGRPELKEASEEWMKAIGMAHLVGSEVRILPYRRNVERDYVS